MKSLLVLLFVSLTATAFAKDQAMDTTLDENGWNVVAEQDASAQLAHFVLVIRSGSLSDPVAFPGLAGFTGKALLRGTKTRPYRELMDAIERMGGSLSVSVDQSATTFRGKVLASQMDAFIDLLRDIFTFPAFEAQEMLALRGIVQGEIRSELQDGRKAAGRAVMQRIYRGTEMELPPQGTVASIAKITRVEAEAFFKSHYVRENIVIGVSSPLAVADAVKKITRGLNTIGHGASDARPIPAPSIRGRHAIIVNRSDMATTPMFFAVPGISDADGSSLELDLGNFVFGADFTSRLIQVLRAEHGWTYGAYSAFDQLLEPKAEPGLFSIYTFPSVQFTGDCMTTALSMFDKYVAAGITEEEFQSARDALANRYPFSMDTSEKRLDLRMREILTGRAYETPDHYRARLAALTREKVNATIAAKTSTDSVAISLVGDAETLRPYLIALPKIQTIETIEF